MRTRASPSADVASQMDAPPSPPMHVYLAGVGSVGSALLGQIADRDGSSLRVIGACTSERAIWADAGLAPDQITARLDAGDPLDWPEIMNRLTQEGPRPLVFVDATGSAEVADRYEHILRAGIHLVTASKIANTRSQAAFDRLRAAAADAGVQYRYETTVGAGLPVVRTIRNLVATGDRVRSIRGTASGTLTFLFNALREGSTFSEAVRAAIDRGYAEPDVRDDLSGTDVARKFLILARTAGYRVERDDVTVESLVPDGLASRPYDAFLDHLDAADDDWRARSRTAAADGTVLQYVGRLSTGDVDVGVRRVPADSATGRLAGTDNLFEITTDRYADASLTIRGPGAGPEMTAAGILADVLAVAQTAARLPKDHPKWGS